MYLFFPQKDVLCTGTQTRRSLLILSNILHGHMGPANARDERRTISCFLCVCIFYTRSRRDSSICAIRTRTRTAASAGRIRDCARKTWRARLRCVQHNVECSIWMVHTCGVCIDTDACRCRARVRSFLPLYIYIYIGIYLISLTFKRRACTQRVENTRALVHSGDTPPYKPSCTSRTNRVKEIMSALF